MWMGRFFDFGLGNGLRNKLGEAIANNDTLLAKTLVSTTVFMLLLISLFIYIIFG